MPLPSEHGPVRDVPDWWPGKEEDEAALARLVDQCRTIDLDSLQPIRLPQPRRTP